jgi:hypothetical protein
MRKVLIITAIILVGFHAAGASATDTIDQQGKGRLILSAAEDSPSSMLAKCCWAEGRSAFHFCSEYGICTRDPKETCVGVGAAEGLQRSCASPPPERDAKSALR